MNAQFIYDTALAYRQFGFDVIPDHPTKKYPAGIDEWQDREFTEDELKNFILKKGWGVGLRNQEGLDFDNKGNPSADELYTGWRELVEKQAPGLVDRLVIEKTQSGGYHAAWKCDVIEPSKKLATRPPTPAELETDPQKREVTLVETKGTGGQFMVAPSPGYQLVQSSWPNIVEITPAERELLLNCARAFDMPKPEATRGPQAAKNSNSDRPGDVYNQNHATEALALLKAAGWTELYTREKDNVTYWRRPGKDRDVSATWDIGGKKLFYPFSTNSSPFEAGKSYSPFAIYTTLQHAGNYEAAAKELAHRFGLNGKSEPGQVLDLPEVSIIDTSGEAARPVFVPLSLTELFKRPPKQWLIDGFLGKNDLAMVFGEAGSGKTFVTLAAIVEAATGRPVADQFNVARPLSVIYCAGEGVAGLPGRFVAALNKYHVRPDEVNITIYTDVPQLFETSTEANIYTFVSELQASGQRPDLVIIDTMFSANVGGNENDAKEFGITLQSVKYARDALGCTVLLVHHANKAGGYRGTTAQHGSFDTMLQTKADTAGYGWLECYKQKDAEGFNRIPFKIVGEPVSQSAYVEWGEITTFDNEPAPRERAKEAIIELLENEPAITQNAITKKLVGIASRVTVINVLNELETHKEIMVSNGDNRSKLYQVGPVV